MFHRKRVSDSWICLKIVKAAWVGLSRLFAPFKFYSFRLHLQPSTVKIIPPTYMHMPFQKQNKNKKYSCAHVTHAYTRLPTLVHSPTRSRVHVTLHRQSMEVVGDVWFLGVFLWIHTKHAGKRRFFFYIYNLLIFKKHIQPSERDHRKLSSSASHAGAGCAGVFIFITKRWDLMWTRARKRDFVGVAIAGEGWRHGTTKKMEMKKGCSGSDKLLDFFPV